MPKTKIEWCTHSANPVKGLCPVACEYCYARAMYKRFKWNPEIRFEPKAMLDISTIREPSRIFVGSTMELFGDWVKPEWLEMIFEYCRRMPQHIFIFLTKKPANLIKWSPFPDNCQVGVSCTNDTAFTYAWEGLKDIQAKVKFISFEPLLSWNMTSDDIIFSLTTAGINQVIIGAETKNGKLAKEHIPQVEWIRGIVEAADKSGVKVFLKNNLWNEILVYEGEPNIYFTESGKLRQTSQQG
jgi:protein gp37